ncbi:hypothetical protein S245_054787, partial [Arachis hypogaea]
VYCAFLLAFYDYNNEEFQSICKIGTGFTEDVLEARSKSLGSQVIPEPKVWEVKAADLTISPFHYSSCKLRVLVHLELPRCILDTSDPSKPGSKPDDSLAIVWRDEGFDDTDLNHITLKQLRQLLVANAIEATFSKGDAIAIDMQMTTSAVIIYLAIVLTRCGVVSIADSFAPKEIATCLHISKAKGTFTQ